VLIEMGMGVAFDPARADFGRLVQGAAPGTGPWIEWVKQKSFAKVDEEGTEAAAATAVSINVSAHAVVRADRPFLFAIRERFSGAILFVGTVTDPTAG
jgi:serpin B